MAPTIQLLSDSMVSKIAAGEVIERPASVVKELVENSIDAGAGTVSVNVIEGGRHAIVVTDDGSGMRPEDVELSVARHATSKLRSATDLSEIGTLGFRGEALASVAAVSRLTIESRFGDDAAGTRLSIEGGIRRSLEPVGRSRGTTVHVRNLFFNTPARRKFLRRVDTEMRHITQVISQLGAAYPHIGFNLSHGERTIVEMHSGTPSDRGGVLLVSNDLIRVADEGEETHIEGYLSRPDKCGRSKAKQFIVVGGRPVFSRILNQAVYRAYAGLHPKEMHPSFVVWLTVRPHSVDMNVHPSKREIRIANEREISSRLEKAVHGALMDAPGAEDPPGRRATLTDRVAESSSTGFYRGKESADLTDLSIGGPKDIGPVEEFGQLELQVSTREMEVGRPASLCAEEVSYDTPIWQVHRKYIMTPASDGLMVVDQHVAHERIRYEEALDCFEAENGTSQQLLFPFTVGGDHTEMEAIREAQDLLQKLGFGIRDFGPNSVIVDSIPANLNNWDDGALFHRIVSEILDEKEIRDTLKEAVAASYACHTSIRAGEKLSEREMRILVQRLLNTRKPNICPHGRPIIVLIPLTELDRHFERS
jgi:DNA mismatch repair protein MutL